ncbi:NADPH-dependent F420 reductase [Neptunitalea lumnitzerae]|uniref:NADPH-dependent F420 reductase n=1 Tax=Neptunitalea lumnitzerae TaxID=2965509 RepID=A0ABQ5MFY3_9FLAO|nr:NAD(P)-binding domain-containing protein [Neptunitalea sp. Y10]GLB48331.1 NADPH-dependent F420 reductase [Neptunitalea sp. Y10]
MIATQTIAIIGAAGNMGSAIAKSLAKGNYNLLLQASHVQKAQGVLNEIKKANPDISAEVINCSFEASWEADIIILAVPYQAEQVVAEKIREVANQKIVISVSNPLNSTYNGLLTNELSAAEELQDLLPNAKVVKAFNTTFKADFEKPFIKDTQVDAFIAGDNKEAVATVKELIETVGFRAVNAGGLSVSRTLERMQLLLIQLSVANNYNWHAGWKVLHN